MNTARSKIFNMDSNQTNFNGTKPNNQGRKPGATTPTTNPPGKTNNQPSAKKLDNHKFTGHNQEELKGVSIMEDTIPKHFIELWKRLETMGGNKCVPKVATLIETPTRFMRKEFAPVKPEPEDHTKTVAADDGTETTKNGEEMQSTLEDIMYQEELKIKAEEWIKYQHNMEKMYQITLGEIGDCMKAKLKDTNEWKDATEGKCVIRLIKLLRQVCHQSSRTKVHPPTNVLRVMRKLVCTQQRGMEPTSYVKTIKEHPEVLKSLGGSGVCKSLVEYEIKGNMELVAKYSTYTGYQDTPRLLQKPIDKAMEQQFLATIIVEGSDKDTTSELKKTLRNNYSFMNDKYPSTILDTALDMLNVFKSTKRGKDKGTTGGGGHNTPKTTMRLQHLLPPTNHQLLMHAVEGGEDFGREYHQFLQLGVESDTTERYLLVTNSIKELVERNESDDEECSLLTLDPPALIPRTTSCDDSCNWLIATKDSIKHDDLYVYDATPVSCTKGYRHAIQRLMTQQNKLDINPNWIILDIESSINLIINPKMVRDVKEAPDGKYMIVHCNSGKAVTNQTEIDNKLYAYCDGWAQKFNQSESNLYYYDMREHNGNVLAMNMIHDKEESYSALDCQRKKKARLLQVTIGFPSKTQSIRIVEKNIINNCPITRRDINLMEDIYGKHTSILKGKSAIHQAGHAREDINSVLPECIKTIAAGEYAARGFHVVQLHADNQFVCLTDGLLLSMEEIMTGIPPDVDDVVAKHNSIFRHTKSKQTTQQIQGQLMLFIDLLEQATVNQKNAHRAHVRKHPEHTTIRDLENDEIIDDDDASDPNDKPVDPTEDNPGGDNGMEPYTVDINQVGANNNLEEQNPKDQTDTETKDEGIQDEMMSSYVKNHNKTGKSNIAEFTHNQEMETNFCKYIIDVSKYNLNAGKDNFNASKHHPINGGPTSEYCPNAGEEDPVTGSVTSAYSPVIDNTKTGKTDATPTVNIPGDDSNLKLVETEILKRVVMEEKLTRIATEGRLTTGAMFRCCGAHSSSNNIGNTALKRKPEAKRQLFDFPQE
eukprot:jgi/Psemu1/2269/gm1.2269_g